jgi:hypothetical protein
MSMKYNLYQVITNIDCYASLRCYPQAPAAGAQTKLSEQEALIAIKNWKSENNANSVASA